ncbi:uncharacterized protein A4U43_C01F2180 [Asparagus officinalis]|uniref:Beta-glucosidase n=1 Tax=Asparagus officinalis TaxID=4686 RepID=A0A5P1FMR6_ASPOF|nr:beta-glucosidase 12-like [Asparagus officinalis]ONK79033.1 uncharacterized protein A4U43_C01F2180 [Asparagus officinalis]
MALGDSLISILAFILAINSVLTGSRANAERNNSLSRRSFPAGFVFGTASAAYQFEGAVNEGGRGPSIWDNFTHRHPEKIADGSNGDIAEDQYHRYKEDIKRMKEIGLDAYRLSISWTRILPNGSLSGGINQAGVNHYNNLINELLSSGLQPLVTLNHFDPPQGLEDEYGGYLSRRIVEDFLEYSEICFREFGDRVKHWVTLNEPSMFCTYGYGTGRGAPGRCSRWEGNCSAGDSSREPYIACHNQLLAHAAAVKLYRSKYQGYQKGKIGISLSCNWFLPFSDSKPDRDAAQRAVDFMYGWFMDPLTEGEYPVIMRELVGDRLPKFTEEQSEIVKGSFDFIGLNYYSTNYVSNLPVLSNNVHASYNSDLHVNVTGIRNGIPIGGRTGVSSYYNYPQGLRDALLYTKTRYNNPTIYITENGMAEPNNKTATVEESVKDRGRVQFFKGHLLHLQQSIREGVDVKGYFAWSLLDDFEWAGGYTVRFGIYYIDYEDGLRRYPKSSAFWFQSFLKT